MNESGIGHGRFNGARFEVGCVPQRQHAVKFYLRRQHPLNRIDLDTRAVVPEGSLRQHFEGNVAVAAPDAVHAEILAIDGENPL